MGSFTRSRHLSSGYCRCDIETRTLHCVFNIYLVGNLGCGKNCVHIIYKSVLANAMQICSIHFTKLSNVYLNILIFIICYTFVFSLADTQFI